jgi:hypothetical protein
MTDPAPRPWLWAGLFLLTMAGTAAASIFEVLDNAWRTVLFFVAMGLLVPMVRASRARYEAQGCMSPALRRYNNRVLVAMTLYMASFFVAVGVHDRVAAGSAVLWLLATVPVMPLLGMIWAMQRYLGEETDEYLRHRAIQAALFGLALVLVVGTVWGFLETFGLVPHVWAWWVFPAWAIGLAGGFGWSKARGQ